MDASSTVEIERHLRKIFRPRSVPSGPFRPSHCWSVRRGLSLGRVLRYRGPAVVTLKVGGPMKSTTGLKGVTLALTFVAGAAATGVLSQGMVNRPQLSAALANELVGDTVAICASRGYKVWAVVVNL